MGVMDDEPGTYTPEPEPTPAPAAPRSRRRARPAAGAGTKRTPARVEKRASATATTVRELVRLRKPDLDVSGLSFLDVVDRDADAWGRFVAQLAETFVPFGQLIDLIFGAPLMALIGLAPSIRAARRDLAGRKARVQREREQERAQAEAEQAAAEYAVPPDLSDVGATPA